MSTQESFNFIHKGYSGFQHDLNPILNTCIYDIQWTMHSCNKCNVSPLKPRVRLK